MKSFLMIRWCAVNTLVLLQYGCIEGTVHTCMHHNNAAMTLCPMIIHAMFCHSGTVKLSPSGVAPVCSGGQLELTCTVTGEFLQWRFSVFRGNETTATEIRRAVESIGPVTSNLTCSQLYSIQLLKDICS